MLPKIMIEPLRAIVPLVLSELHAESESVAGSILMGAPICIGLPERASIMPFPCGYFYRKWNLVWARLWKRCPWCIYFQPVPNEDGPFQPQFLNRQHNAELKSTNVRLHPRMLAREQKQCFAGIPFVDRNKLARHAR
jgi:hypothetical protein